MYKTIFFTLLTFSFLATPLMAADMPPAYKKCKSCHGLPGGGGKKNGPDLANSKMTLEQYVKQVKTGSKWEGRPPKMKGFEKKKMRGSKKLTNEQIKEIYDYIKAAK